MPIILSERDLQPLLNTPARMDELLARIEAAMRAQSSGANAGLARIETSLLDAKQKYRIMTSAVPNAGQGMRINALFRGAKDAYFILLFDGERGDLLALVAGRDLNVWRTGAPGGRCGQIAGELGDVILGKVPARVNDSETVVFESVGMPIWDTAATAWAYRWAVEQGAGTSFSLE